MPDGDKTRPVPREGVFSRGRRAAERLHRESEIHVVFTTWAGTQAALVAASQWARDLESKIVVEFLELVPRQFALRRPPISLELATQRLSRLATQCCSGLNVEIRCCLCTDFRQCLLISLLPEAIVFLGGRNRWWRSWEKKLAEFLKDWGHVVMFVDAREDRRAELLVPERTSA